MKLPKHYTKGPRSTGISQVVIHTMESGEHGNTAEQVAAWFAGPTAPQASIHVCVDNNSAVRVLPDADVAWHSGVWEVNSRSLGIELAGSARQTPKQWADAYSRAELRQAAKVVAAWCKRYSIPIRLLTPAEVKAGKRGICGHDDVTKGYNVRGGHSDPGKHFPWEFFLGLVREAAR